MGEKKPETASQMLESFNEFLLGQEPDFKTMPAEKVAAYLQKNKLDAAPVARAARAMLGEMRGQMELARAREKRLRIDGGAPPPSATGMRAALLDKIRTLAGSQAAAVYARRFEDSPDEDLRSLVEDFEYLDQLDLDDDEQ